MPSLRQQFQKTLLVPDQSFNPGRIYLTSEHSDATANEPFLRTEPRQFLALDMLLDDDHNDIAEKYGPTVNNQPAHNKGNTLSRCLRNVKRFFKKERRADTDVHSQDNRPLDDCTLPPVELEANPVRSYYPGASNGSIPTSASIQPNPITQRDANASSLPLTLQAKTDTASFDQKLKRTFNQLKSPNYGDHSSRAFINATILAAYTLNVALQSSKHAPLVKQDDLVRLQCRLQLALDTLLWGNESGELVQFYAFEAQATRKAWSTLLLTLESECIQHTDPENAQLITFQGALNKVEQTTCNLTLATLGKSSSEVKVSPIAFQVATLQFWLHQIIAMHGFIGPSIYEPKAVPEIMVTTASQTELALCNQHIRMVVDDTDHLDLGPRVQYRSATPNSLHRMDEVDKFIDNLKWG